ncbi:MAG: DUF4290 domain-containing protein [Chlorobi bacterium]|nr:DUF4290 domain-containing protein [Chlorobiota bacterium]
MGKRKPRYNYNTTREPLKLPEYGRHIHEMVQHLKTIPERDTRNKAAQTLIAIMQNMTPHRDMNGDFKHKLWDHLTIMADYDLDIDAPYELPTQDKMAEKPRKVPYASEQIRFKHYGHLTEELISTASGMPEGEEKSLLIKMIANHMKRQYLKWNRQQVTDEVIFNDMITLAGGKLKIPDELILKENKDLLGKKKKKNFRKK